MSTSDDGPDSLTTPVPHSEHETLLIESISKCSSLADERQRLAKARHKQSALTNENLFEYHFNLVCQHPSVQESIRWEIKYLLHSSPFKHLKMTLKGPRELPLSSKTTFVVQLSENASDSHFSTCIALFLDPCSKEKSTVIFREVNELGTSCTRGLHGLFPLSRLTRWKPWMLDKLSFLSQQRERTSINGRWKQLPSGIFSLFRT